MVTARLCYIFSDVPRYTCAPVHCHIFAFYIARDPLLPSNEDGLSAQAQRRANRRKEPRRHTLANGVDFNMVGVLLAFIIA